MALALGFYGLTTTVAPGAGTKVASIPINVGGNQAEIQVVAIADPTGIPIGPDNPQAVEIFKRGTAAPIHGSIPVQSSEQTVVSYTVPAGKVLLLNDLTFACHFDGVGRLKVNGVERSVLRTGPGQPSPTKPLDVDDAAAGAVILLTFEGRSGVPTSALVAATLDARLVDAPA